MGAEDWEAYRELRKQAERERKKTKEARRVEFARRFDNGELDTKWIKHHHTHYSYMLLGSELSYWPGPKKWRWRQTIRHGDVLEFIRRAEENAGDKW